MANIGFDLYMKDMGGIATGQKYANTLDRMSTSHGTASGSAGGLWKQMLIGAGIIGGVSAAYQKVTGFVKDSITAFGESERVNAQLNATLKSTGEVAGITAIEVQKMASELQSMTTYDDEATISAANLLLTFTKIGKDVFPEALAIVQDMSTALGQDLQSSSIQVGKALQDPVLGVTALRRVGVNFSKDQVEVIKAMVDTGKAADAQALILRELQTEFGGSAKAAAETFPGALQQLKNAFGDLQEKVGESIIQNADLRGGFDKLKAMFTDPAFVNNIADLFGGLASLLVGIGDGIVTVTNVLLPLKDLFIAAGIAWGTYWAINKFTPVFNSLSSYFKTLNADAGKTFIDLETGGIRAGGAMGKLGAAIKSMPTALKIAIVVAGAELAGKILANMYDTLGSIYDKQMALIMDSASKAEGEAHKITAEILAFRNAGAEYESAFQAARVELEKFLVPTDTNLTKQQKLKEILIALHPEWQDYQDRLKEIGAKADGLNISLDENYSNYVAYKSLIGTMTDNEMQKELDKRVKLGEITGTQKDQILELNKKYEEHREEINSLADSLGILTRDGYIELNKEAGNLYEIFETNKTQITESKDKTDALAKKVLETVDAFGGWKNVPPTITALWQELQKFYMIAVPTSSILIDFFPDSWLQSLGRFTNDLPGATVAVDRYKTTMTGVPGVLIDWNKELYENEQQLKKNYPELDKNTTSAQNLADTFTSLSTTINSAFDALGKLGINLGALPGIIQGVTGGLNSIGSGINAIQTAKSGFLGTLSSISGGFSIATGAITIFSGILKLLSGKSGELKAAERRLEGLTGTTKDWAKKIEDLAKTMYGADTAGRAFNSMLDDIIGSSDITIANFDTYIAKVREIVSTYEQGNAGIEETSKNFGDAFSAMLKAAQDLGLEGGAAMTGLILEAKEFGLNVKAISDYVNGELKQGLQGWQDAVVVFGGYSIDVYQDMLDLQAKIADNQALIDAITGANTAMMGLANAGQINETQFGTFQQIAVDAMTRLQAAGFDATQAMSSDAGLRGMLQNIIFLSEQYGFKIDDATQAMIDQGVQAGILTQKTKSDSDIMRDGFERVGFILEKIAESFGVYIPESLDTLATRGNNALSQVNSSTSQWNNNINNVNANIRDTIDNLNTLGNTHGDIMTGHSIIPEVEAWRKQLEYLKSKEMKEALTGIKELGSEHTRQTSDWYTEIGGVSRAYEKFAGELESAVPLSPKGTAIERGSRGQTATITEFIDSVKTSLNGLHVEVQEIADIPLGEEMGEELAAWQQKMKWFRENELMKLQKDMQAIGESNTAQTNTIIDNIGEVTDAYTALAKTITSTFTTNFQETGVKTGEGNVKWAGNDKEKNLISQIESLRKKQMELQKAGNKAGAEEIDAQIKRLLDEIAKLRKIPRLATGTPPEKAFKIPTGFNADNYLMGFKSGEIVQVQPPPGITPLPETGKGKGGGRGNVYIENVYIQAAKGDDPKALMEKFYYGLTHDAGSFRTKIMKELAA